METIWKLLIYFVKTLEMPSLFWVNFIKLTQNSYLSAIILPTTHTCVHVFTVQCHPVIFLTSTWELCCVLPCSDLSVSLLFFLSPQRRKRAPPQTLPARTDSVSPLAGAATENPSAPTVQTRLMQSAVSSRLVALGGRANTTSCTLVECARSGKKGSRNTCRSPFANRKHTDKVQHVGDFTPALS